MSLGHLSVPVHAMHAMSQGHTGTFTFGFKTPRLSRRMDWVWQYFNVPGISISLCSCYACHVPGTYRYPLILFQISPFVKAHGFRLIIFSYPRDIYQSLFMLCTPCPRDIEVPLLAVSKLPVFKIAPRDIYQYLFMLCMSCPRDCFKAPRLSRRMDWDWLSLGHLSLIIPLLSCPRDILIIFSCPCSCYACHVPGTYRYFYIRFQISLFVKAHGLKMTIFSCLPAMHAMSRGHTGTFTFCFKTPRLSQHVRLIIFSYAFHVPGTYRNLYFRFQKLPVCQGAWIEIDNVFMSPGHLPVPVHAMHAMSQEHTGTFTFSFKIPVYQVAWIKINNVFMSPGHLSVTVHVMHDMSQGHVITFGFKTPRLFKAHGLRLIIFSCPRDIYQPLFMLCMPGPRDIQVL